MILPYMIIAIFIIATLWLIYTIIEAYYSEKKHKKFLKNLDEYESKK